MKFIYLFGCNREQNKMLIFKKALKIQYLLNL